MMVRLMMAINDLALVNQSFIEWNESQDPKRAERKMGARSYFARLQMSHLYEALSIIDEIAKSDTLQAAVELCDARTRRSFETVNSFLSSHEYVMMRRIRQNTAFHYDKKLPLRYLERLVSKLPGKTTSYSLGTEPLDWYFVTADEIVDSILVRDIFCIPEGAEVHSAVDSIVERYHKMGQAFADFAAYFIRHHFK